MVCLSRVSLGLFSLDVALLVVPQFSSPAGFTSISEKNSFLSPSSFVSLFFFSLDVALTIILLYDE